MLRSVLLCVLTLATAAGAANVTCPNALLTPTAQTATGASANTVTARGATALVVEAFLASGTATVQLEICCSPLDCTVASTWAPVLGSVMALTGATQAQAVSLLAPTCLYRTNVTACTACNVTTAAACAGP
jgi:hypothetical protein